jgi:hypothetical protein
VTWIRVCGWTSGTSLLPSCSDAVCGFGVHEPCDRPEHFEDAYRSGVKRLPDRTSLTGGAGIGRRP